MNRLTQSFCAQWWMAENWSGQTRSILSRRTRCFGSRTQSFRNCFSRRGRGVVARGGAIRAGNAGGGAIFNEGGEKRVLEVLLFLIVKGGGVIGVVRIG